MMRDISELQQLPRYRSLRVIPEKIDESPSSRDGKRVGRLDMHVSYLDDSTCPSSRVLLRAGEEATVTSFWNDPDEPVARQLLQFRNVGIIVLADSS